MRLSITDVSFGYGSRPVLKGVSLDVHDGELLGLVGPNGAGKSTLLKCIYGAVKPQAGTIFLDDRDLLSLRPVEIARLVGVVPQSFDATFPVSVRYFVGMGRFSRERFLGGPTREDRIVVDRCLEELHLTEYADRSVNEMSGGEFRRVLIAQVLAQQPRVLLLDEPVQQLDLLHKLEVMEFSRDFTRRGGTAGVIVLHDLALASRYCDRICLLDQGRVVASGLPEEVLSEKNVSNVYGVQVSIQRCRETGSLQFIAVAPAGRQPPEIPWSASRGAADGPGPAGGGRSPPPVDCAVAARNGPPALPPSQQSRSQHRSEVIG